MKMKTNKEYWEYDLQRIEGEIISKGKVGGAILHKLLELCNKHFYIHIEESAYGEYGELDWIDIEGIGYGWKWLSCEDENDVLDEQKNHDVLVDHIKMMIGFILNRYYDNSLWYTHVIKDDYEQVILYNQMNDGYEYSYKFSDKKIGW